MCARAQTLAQPVQDDLEFQLSLVGRHNNLDAVTALTASVAAMTVGPTREKYERKLRRATERQAQLTDRLTDFDGVALTDNEFDRRRLTAALTETTTYLAELAARKAALPS